jgi:hypothetical protein
LLYHVSKLLRTLSRDSGVGRNCYRDLWVTDVVNLVSDLICGDQLLHAGHEETKRIDLGDLRVLFVRLDSDHVVVCLRVVTCDDLDLRILVARSNQNYERWCYPN